MLFTVDKDVEVGEGDDKVKITYNKDSYTFNEGTQMSATVKADISGVYDGTTFRVNMDIIFEGEEARGTLTYTEGTKVHPIDVTKFIDGEPATDKTSPEYKTDMIYSEVSNNADTYIQKYTYSITGKTVAENYTVDNGKLVKYVESKDATTTIDQRKTDGVVTVTKDSESWEVRYDIKKDGENFTETSYMHVKKAGDTKYKKYPLVKIAFN